ncbi:hypothetical protein EVAR_96511_1 [Eumeta japonica]|uniref:Uncharacterized protein n=1 Tax=Eumeta variegata TaxID=151549 RepID=A0A4C1WGC8_EUMVA|nr:hypothetical protein EVAR_96511_1 [Eumeta japonica]
MDVWMFVDRSSPNLARLGGNVKPSINTTLTEFVRSPLGVDVASPRPSVKKSYRGSIFYNARGGIKFKSSPHLLLRTNLLNREQTHSFLLRSPSQEISSYDRWFRSSNRLFIPERMRRPSGPHTARVARDVNHDPVDIV